MLSVYLKLPISFQTYWYNVLRNTLTLLLKKNFPTECLVHSFATVFANSFFRTMNVPQIIARHPKHFSSLFFFLLMYFIYLFLILNFLKMILLFNTVVCLPPPHCYPQPQPNPPPSLASISPPWFCPCVLYNSS